jgi:hypothetical protein
VSVEAISWALNLTPALPARAASPPARASSGLPGWPAMLGRMGRVRSRRWRWSLTRAWPSGRCAAAWASWRPGASSGSVTGHRGGRIKPRPAAGRRTPRDLTPGPRRLTDTEMAALERQFPAWRPGSWRPDRMTVRSPAGVGSPHPAGMWITGLTRRSRCTPHPRPAQPAGCSRCSHGDRTIRRSPGDVDAPGRVRPRRVFLQPADASPSHQPGEARSLQKVADRPGGSAHTPAVRSTSQWAASSSPRRRLGCAIRMGRRAVRLLHRRSLRHHHRLRCHQRRRAFLGFSCGTDVR